MDERSRTVSEKGNEVKVYGRPGCVQCEYTVKALTKNDVPHIYLDINENQVANEEVKNLATGTALPLVVAPNGEQWQGFSPDKIKRLAR